jgi:hypothetical protein
MESSTSRVGEGPTVMTDNNKPSGSKLPKGAYPVPGGGYVTESRHQDGKKVIIIRAVHRDPPDMDKLAKAFLLLAQQLSETDSQRAIDRQSQRGRRVQ